MHDISYTNPSFLDDLANTDQTYVHLVLIATKPDIIKQVPLYLELKKRGHLVVLGHTGQHYDENLSGGMLKEFGVQPDFNLGVRGELYEVIGQIITRLGWVIHEIKKRGKTVIPYVHGDTTTAMAASNAGYSHGCAAVHVEAGIRTLTPDYTVFDGGTLGGNAVIDAEMTGGNMVDAVKWREFLMKRENWKRGSQEPIPEQFNTRCSEAGSGVHLAPVELVREFLQGEGFNDDRIFVVGNSVVDATRTAIENSKNSTIFETYPQLKDGNFVRFCIHRRENCMSEKRFTAIVGAMIDLIKEGKTVLLISLFQTEAALERYGLKQEIEGLAKTHKNFIYSPVWPLYTDVMAVMNKASVCATDSGSMQEEMNVLGVPCVTLRFGSDRSESIMNGGNIIAPPVNKDAIKQLIEFAWDNEDMKNAPKIYGENVSKKCIDAVESVLASGDVMRTEEERLGIG